MAFSKKSIRVVVQRETGEFREGVNTIDFRGLPVELSMNYAGVFSTAKIKIYGLSKQHIDEITRLPIIMPIVSLLYVKVFIDEGFGEEELFIGAIKDASPNFSQAPDVFIEISCYAGTFSNSLGNIPPTSVDGDVPAPILFGKICEDYGVKLVNHDVKKICTGSPRYAQVGLMNRLKAASEDYDILTEVYNEEIHIWENSHKVWNITKDDYIGYPTFTQTGISVVLDKAIRIRISDSFIISGSEIEAANGRWHVNTVQYNLSTKIGGKWLLTIKGYRELTQ